MTIEAQERPDKLLVEAAQDGHLESFGALYQRYYSSMVTLAYSMLADRDLAEDAAQESFVVACRDLSNLRSKDKFGPWLAGICRNITRQMYRAEGKSIALNVSASPENESKKDCRVDAICRAVWKLPASDRELIVLRYYDNMHYEQIAQILDISIQAVNGRLIRAKRKIAKYLKRDGFTRDSYKTH